MKELSKSGLGLEWSSGNISDYHNCFQQGLWWEEPRKLAEFTYFLPPPPPSHKLPQYITWKRRENNELIPAAHFCGLRYRLHNGWSVRAQNILVHPGARCECSHKAHSWNHILSLFDISSSWGVGWNIHLVTPGWSKKESNPDNLRGVQILVSSQPHVLRRVSIILHLLVLRFCSVTQSLSTERRQESLSQTG